MYENILTILEIRALRFHFFCEKSFIYMDFNSNKITLKKSPLRLIF